MTGMAGVEPTRSWTGGDTIPMTPNTMLQNFTNKMPVGAEVSTDISASIRSGAAEHSLHSSVNTISQYRGPDHRPLPCSANPTLEHVISSPTCTNNDGVSTRRMTSTAVAEPTTRAPRPRFEYGLLPRISNSPLAANRLCIVLGKTKKRNPKVGLGLRNKIQHMQLQPKLYN
ncbi:hypothetical protein KC19_VG195800 [Ceratodon purpureus]|uniref:Uncharacterized protein n=1 Tax=Ceratodon purpureus TaxID=3225 RepID=A0A8T0HS62_CERPU|nr:hypothetical protein KC19_VG195800 [Ceratodon purpureus]